jgi:two-component SAPR family response regulator
MWPELEPSSAANSLNQTLYFLRRDIEPDYEEAVSANYVHFEGELLWLDRELVAVESARFFRSAIEIDPSDGPLGDTLDLLRMYVGRFAPEFEYEDWAIDWRDRLHASYLRLVARAQVRLLRLGRVDEALACTEHALAVDPGALGVRRAYVWLLGHAGAQAAASEQFRRYAMAHREEVGEDPGDLTELLGEEFETPSGGRRRSRDYVSRRIDPPSSHA